jgi:hypothetical protein
MTVTIATNSETTTVWGTQRVTDELKWVSTTASALNSLTQLQVTSTNTHVANYGDENSERTTSNIFRVVQEGRWYARIHTMVTTLETCWRRRFIDTPY